MLIRAAEHDPEKWKPVLLRDKRESVCAEIMLKKERRSRSDSSDHDLRRGFRDAIPLGLNAAAFLAPRLPQRHPEQQIGGGRPHGLPVLNTFHEDGIERGRKEKAGEHGLGERASPSLWTVKQR